MTKAQAAQHLGISVRNLDALVAEAGHLDGGPCDGAPAGSSKKSLRFSSATIDDWFREARRIRPPSSTKTRKARRSKRRDAVEATMGSFDWDSV